MLFIIAGTNDFTRTRAVEEIVKTFAMEHGDIALERIDGETADYARIGGAINSLPFLASKKMVLLSHASLNKELSEHIDDILKDIPESTDLVIVEGKLDKRTAYYKLLKARKEFKEYGELDETSLVRWLVESAKERGGELSRMDARHLVDRAGYNQQMLSNELDKLLLYGNKISRETIDAMVDQSPRGTIFELMESAFSGQLKKTMALYDEQRRQRVEPQAILALIVWQLHILALIKAAGDRSSSEIARDSGTSSFVVGKSMSVARSLSTSKLKDLIHQALTLDIRLKSEPIDADGALKNLLISIST